ncbi:MAG: neutral/alkaline non-lysosomal ceramidase N-terminal domain-containing protein, partial [Actinomycetota bacterium]
MSRRVFTVLSALSLLLVMLPSVRAQEPVDQGCVRAGYGEADATWHVGVSAGQYANDRAEEMDPHAHHVKRAPSYGVQSRLFTRAIVVEGCNGERVALVKNDNYLAQDMLQRRTAQILAAEGSQVTYDRILLAATHNHSSPYVYSMAWGVQLFQDAFDIRAFEFQARRTAEAILEAEASMVSARMGATTVQHDIFKANIPGPEIADDDTPGGYPRDFGDEGIVVMRFDDAASGDPVAAWVNHGQHPESLDGYDLITADFLAPLERFVQRETGAPMVFSQGDVGSSEGPYEGWDVPQGRYLPDGTRRAWAHMGYAQAERGARYLADSIIAAFDQIGAGAGQVAYSDSFEVDAYEEGWIPGPISHPYPSVWNCRTENQATGKPNGPGVPTCGDVLHEIHEGERDPTLVAIYEGLKKLGVPIPEHGPLNGPAHMAVEENNRLRLQVVKVGDVVLGSCACEAQVDLILNFESRADDAVGNIWDGFDYDGGDPDHPEYDCVPNEDTTWTCTWPGGKTTVSDYYYQRMKAQVHNPADGWDALDYVPFANSEPYEPPDIKGNFTKEELSAEHGYKLAVGIGHAGDYNGYTVSYREYMNRDHYRKSLTSYGPHTADYMVTRMVWMAGALSGAPDRLAADPYYRLEAADEARQEALAVALGRASSGVYDNWYANLPEDKVPATLEDQVLEQPKDISRFDAAQFSWIGGSNAVDNPLVRVERLDDGEWTFYGDQSGEVQTFLEFPEAVSGVLETWGGEHEWRWTANFEAFDFGPRASIDPRASQVPEGDYRFVVAGRYRQGGADRDYELVSDAFSVTKWEGITVEDFRGEENGVSFTVTGATNPTETDIAPG